MPVVLPNPEIGTKEAVLQWDSLIREISAEREIPAAVLAAVMDVESGGRQDALNPLTWAAGLMQIMPSDAWQSPYAQESGLAGTWRRLFVNRPTKQELLDDPRLNLVRGAMILRGDPTVPFDLDSALTRYFGLGTDPYGYTAREYIRWVRARIAAYPDYRD